MLIYADLYVFSSISFTKFAILICVTPSEFAAIIAFLFQFAPA